MTQRWQDRLRPFPNGATAMREMSHCPEMGLSGCTQVTEILNTPGITLVARLPKEFELATVYTAADLIELLTDADTAALRCSAGFEIAARVGGCIFQPIVDGVSG